MKKLILLALIPILWIGCNQKGCNESSQTSTDDFTGSWLQNPTLLKGIGKAKKADIFKIIKTITLPIGSDITAIWNNTFMSSIHIQMLTYGDNTTEFFISRVAFQSFVEDNSTPVWIRFVEINKKLRLVFQKGTSKYLLDMGSLIPIDDTTFDTYKNAYLNGIYKSAINTIVCKAGTQTTAISGSMQDYYNYESALNLANPKYLGIRLILAQIDQTAGSAGEIHSGRINGLYTSNNNSLTIVHRAINPNGTYTLLGIDYDISNICPPDNCP